MTVGCVYPPVEPDPPPAIHQSVAPAPSDRYTLTVRCTFYYAGERHSDPDTDAGRSSTGVKLHPATATEAGVCAIDPSIIPYGSTVIVQTPEGPRYYIAADTGGAVKHQTASNGTLPVIDFYSDHQVGREIDQATIVPYRGAVPFTQLSISEKRRYFDLNQ